MKIVEDRVSPFAGQIVSNLLALGHARIQDLMQAFGDSKKDASALEATISLPKKPQQNGNTEIDSQNREPFVSLDSLHATLCELVQLGLVSQINASHFRPDTDNRTEAEKIVPPVEAYKAKSRRENEAQREGSIDQKLFEWKNGNVDELVEVNGVGKGKKRLHEDSGYLPEKRQRLQLFESNHGIGKMKADQPKSTRQAERLNV